MNQKAASQIADLKIKYTYPVIGFQEILFDKELKELKKKGVIQEGSDPTNTYFDVKEVNGV